MFGWLADKIRTAAQVRKLRHDPVIAAASTIITAIWSDGDLTRNFSSEFIQTQRLQMMERALEIAGAADRRMANRNHLTNSVLQLSQFQVLVIDPPPTPDPTRLTTCPGVTGTLKPQLLELVQKDKRLREFMHAFDHAVSFADVWDCVLFQYRISWAWAEFHQRLRTPLRDRNPSESRDWYRPFLVAMCAWEEHQYREALSWPSALTDDPADAPLVALAYSTFMNHVMDGATYPDLAWRDACGELIDSNGRSGKPATYALGQQIGAEICGQVDRFLALQMPGLTENLLVVFRNRLMTIHDEPGHHPRVVARAELEIFAEQVQRMPEKLRPEIETYLGAGTAIFSDLQMRPQLDDYITERINEAAVEVMRKAKAMYDEVVAPLPAAPEPTKGMS